MTDLRMFDPSRVRGIVEAKDAEIAELRAALATRSPAELSYQSMFAAAVASLAEISEALGVPADEATTANGNELILERICALQCARSPAELPAGGAESVMWRLHRFLDAAGGEGFVLGGEDAAELFIDIFVKGDFASRSPADLPAGGEGVRKALTELVALKDVKTKLAQCWPNDPEAPVLQREYSRRKDAAWIAARAALAQPPVQPTGRREHCINCGLDVDPHCNCARGRALAAVNAQSRQSLRQQVRCG